MKTFKYLFLAMFVFLAASCGDEVIRPQGDGDGDDDEEPIIIGGGEEEGNCHPDSVGCNP